MLMILSVTIPMGSLTINETNAHVKDCSVDPEIGAALYTAGKKTSKKAFDQIYCIYSERAIKNTLTDSEWHNQAPDRRRKVGNPVHGVHGNSR